MEVHGHLRTASCPHCGAEREMLPLLDQVASGDNPPRCNCGGIFRPNVVLFGDPLPAAFQRAYQWARVCDLLLVVGSSLEVAPVCWLAPTASQLAIINLGKTQCDEIASVLIRGKAGEVLNSFARLEGRPACVHTARDKESNNSAEDSGLAPIFCSKGLKIKSTKPSPINTNPARFPR